MYESSHQWLLHEILDYIISAHTRILCSVVYRCIVVCGCFQRVHSTVACARTLRRTTWWSARYAVTCICSTPATAALVRCIASSVASPTMVLRATSAKTGRCRCLTELANVSVQLSNSYCHTDQRCECHHQSTL